MNQQGCCKSLVEKESETKIKSEECPSAKRSARVCGDAAIFSPLLGARKPLEQAEIALEKKADLRRVDDIRSCASLEGSGETRCSRDLAR
jgi:hypothetical protein